MATPAQLRIRCPDCDTELVVDAATGQVLSHKKAKAPVAGGRTFEDLFSEMKESKTRAEEIFEREKAAFEDRERLFEEKFKEAVKRAEEDPSDARPKRAFDLD
jgi:hypothetical protein